ncbi:response regulator transcription factor [Streptococcus catagoni]|uniref:response regulator transcription factor n=1 Tax=Streptococcus catagoni TaxID=2654874 RepID=UPI00140DA828|nr:response regulator transcription factor [Streptococcus catagoni]
MNKIALIEDDKDLAKLIKEYLEKYDFQVIMAEDFRSIVTFVEANSPDLILLDITLPSHDGFYWANEIRKQFLMPILFMSARTEDYDQVRAIMSGGDDYITKPFSFELLLAKVQSHFRRVYGEYATKEVETLQYGNTSFNLARLTLSVADQTVDLSKNEAILMRVLLKNSPNIVKRELILSEIWDTDMFIEENTLNVSISRIRKKLTDLQSDLRVVTVRGLGYKLELKDDN